MVGRERKAEGRLADRLGKSRTVANALAIGFTIAANGASGAEVRDEVKIQTPSAQAFAEPSKNALAPAATPDCVTQTIAFKAGSSWSLCVKAVTRYGLIISNVKFRKSPSSPYVLIMKDARLGEIFVPYHQGTPRLGDIAYSSFPVLTLSAKDALASDCPAPHARLDGNRICREVRDSGVAAKNDAWVRRGREVVYWAVLDADNYNYIIEWTFRDDGVILGRAGATGTKLDGLEDTKGHMHNFTWRLDIDLNGAGGDTACIHRLLNNLAVAPSTAADRCDQIPMETGLQWDPLQFTSIVISDSALRNARLRPTQYELIPLRSGTARHTEPFMRNDFWITRANASELLAMLLPQYANGEPTLNQDIVLWYTGSVDHEDHMRDEDLDVVPVIWVGFELRPKNLFDGSPFFLNVR